jgi:hypothetical protein
MSKFGRENNIYIGEQQWLIVGRNRQEAMNGERKAGGRFD